MSISEWLDFMPDTVTLDAYVSRNGEGVPAYAGSPVTYPAYIEMKNHLVIDKKGREVMAKGSVYLGTATEPDVLDKLTLPSRFQPVNPPIIAVNVASDEDGPHHVVLEIG